MREHREEAEQKALIHWAKFYKIASPPSLDHTHIIDYLFAIPNGTYLAGSARARAFQMQRLKDTGLKTGVSDLFLAIPRIINPTVCLFSSGLWIEMKAPEVREEGKIKKRPGRISDDQRAFQDLMTRVGYTCRVCYTWQEAKDAIIDYLQIGTYDILDSADHEGE